jgi:hypothetical protein
VKERDLELPFSHDEFLDVFGAYNSLLWPAVAVLWVATAALVWRWLRTGRLNGRVVFALLAVHWTWSGVAYHWLHFRDINPAATLFGALFVLQGALFAWQAVASARSATTVASGLRGVFSVPRGAIGAVLVLYGLLYPVIGLAFGLEYPRLPLFAVPCPTTLVTAGFLVATVGTPRWLAIVPIVWAGIGGSAAFALGIWADLALVVAGAVLALDTLAPSALGPAAARGSRRPSSADPNRRP